MIPYNKPLVLGTEVEHLKNVMKIGSLTGNGIYARRCAEWISKLTPNGKVFLTTSGTSALEFAAILAGLGPGDEVIVPSYTYVSTINAMLLRGVTLVYVDVDPATMNIDHNKIEEAITPQTRAIVPVHYSSVACDMNVILDIAKRYHLLVIEDAATCMTATYKSQALGSLGDIGCFSFHETKNYTSGGQGGCIMVNNPSLFARAEVVFENGTNRRAFVRGEVGSYEWQDLGSNFYMSETAAACLWAHLDAAEQVTARRRQLWDTYFTRMRPLADTGYLSLPAIPEYCSHNGHLFWLKLYDREMRDAFIRFMKEGDVTVLFHFTPLHSSSLGLKSGRFSGEDRFTTHESGRLARLPLYYSMTDTEQDKILGLVQAFFSTSSKEASNVVTKAYSNGTAEDAEKVQSCPERTGVLKTPDKVHEATKQSLVE